MENVSDKLGSLTPEEREQLLRELRGEADDTADEGKSLLPGMLRVKLSCGFEMDIEEDRLDDQELLDAFLRLKNEPAYYGIALTLMIGEDMRQKLYECLRNGKGRVPATEVVKAFEEIIDQLKKVKK